MSSVAEFRITLRENGPYLVEGMPPLFDAAGESTETKETFALCRCGGSSTKPFCDGTHRTNDFDGTEAADRSPIGSRRKAYRAEGVTVFDDRSVCAHAGYCTDGLAAVFSSKQTPWIDPSRAPAEEIVRVVSRCPSGALAYALGDSDEPVVDRGEPGISASADGPYMVRGRVTLVSTDGTRYEARSPYTLCRCGGSKSKPFCDGTHWHIGFKA
jgi:CDGSH-type Zn-finger protein